MIYNWKRKLGRKNTKHELIDTEFKEKKQELYYNCCEWWMWYGKTGETFRRPRRSQRTHEHHQIRQSVEKIEHMTRPNNARYGDDDGAEWWMDIRVGHCWECVKWCNLRRFAWNWFLAWVLSRVFVIWITFETWNYQSISGNSGGNREHLIPNDKLFLSVREFCVVLF